jgi:hypothetical protein
MSTRLGTLKDFIENTLDEENMPGTLFEED